MFILQSYVQNISSTTLEDIGADSKPLNAMEGWY